MHTYSQTHTLSLTHTFWQVCPTVLKKRCRALGIKRWPYRKLTSLHAKISRFENILSNSAIAPPIAMEIQRK